MLSVGQKIKVARLARGYSQKDLKAELPFKINLSKVENDKARIPESQFATLLNVLDINHKYIACDVQNIERPIWLHSNAPKKLLDKAVALSLLIVNDYISAHKRSRAIFPEWSTFSHSDADGCSSEVKDRYLSILIRIYTREGQIYTGSCIEDGLFSLSEFRRYVQERAVPLPAVLNALGIMCIRLPTIDINQIPVFSSWTEYGKPFIVVPRYEGDYSPISMQIAREIGHIAMHRTSDFFAIPKKDEKLEKIRIANDFALKLMLEKADFALDLNTMRHFSIPSIRNLKAKWRVPFQDIIDRAIQLGFNDIQANRFREVISRRAHDDNTFKVPYQSVTKVFRDLVE